MRDDKKTYNSILARIKKGEEYYSNGHMDEHFSKFIQLIHQANDLLSKIPHTEQEALNGFDI